MGNKKNKTEEVKVNGKTYISQNEYMKRYNVCAKTLWNYKEAGKLDIINIGNMPMICISVDLPKKYQRSKK